MESRQKGIEDLKKACVACGQEFPGNLELCPDDGTLLTPIGKEPKVGENFADRYEILGIIGDGGMGKVYKARHNLMKRIVAIKMLLPHLVQSAAALKRFQQEAQAASALNHPNILTVYDFGISDQGMPYLVMDYLEGTSLAALLQEQGYLASERAIHIFSQACSALAHAHQKGVIHRDLKPANIMLIDYDGQPDFLKIVDFGIAKLLQPDGAEQLTHTGEVFGSPLYMSPEQCRGRELDPRSDIYSLGCVMYRTVTGKPVFSGRDPMECMYKQVNDMPMSFNDVVPELGLSEKLESAIFRAISKDVEGRYTNMLEFREALEACRQTPHAPAGHKVFAVPADSPNAIPEDFLTDQLKRPNLASTQVAGPAHSSATSTGGSPALSGSTSGDVASSGVSPVVSSTDSAGTAAIDASSQTSSGTLPPMSSLGGGTDGGAAPSPVADSKPPQMAIIGGAIGLIAIGALAMFSMKGPDHPAQHPLQPPKDLTPAQEQKANVATMITEAKMLMNQEEFGASEKVLKDAWEAAIAQKDSDKKQMEVLPLLADVYQEGDKFALAQETYEKLIDLEQKNNVDDLTIARTKIDVALMMLQQGLNDDAQPLLKDAEKTLSKAPPKDQKGILDVLYGLSKIAVGNGDFNGAIKYLEQAIAKESQNTGGNSDDLAEYMQFLAEIYVVQGNQKLAQTTLDKVLKLDLQRFGPQSPQVGDVYKDMGTLEFQKGQLGKAENFYTKSLEIKQKAFGENSVAAAEVMTAMAMLYTRENKFKQADELFRKALDIRTKELGADSPQAKRTKELYAKLQQRMKGSR
ncbi:MAG: protein kinase [Candidatus Obscuribacterales bacterium]|nr:protein kinase [Candidatus Obscuribacterales bacterium]